jgi:hypothetical protein
MIYERRQNDPEFTREAVRLAEESEKSAALVG